MGHAPLVCETSLAWTPLPVKVGMGRTADSRFDAYRNMILALESVLHHVYPQQGPGEARWFKDALDTSIREGGVSIAV